MATNPTQLRSDLAALHLERTDAVAPSRRKWWIGGLVVLLLAGVIAQRLTAAKVVAVETAHATVIQNPVGSPAFVPVLAGSGYVVSAERYVAIGVRFPGRIERYFVEEGDRVQVGDPLVQIDPREYEAGVAKAAATLAQVRADAALKQKQLVRTRQLARQGIVSREELDVREAEVAVSTATARQVAAELEQARIALEYTVLKAPTSGIILAKLKEVGEIAVPGGFSGSGDLIRIANLSDLRGQVDITEGELSKIRLQQRADVVPDAYPDKHYTAKVIKLYPQVDRQKGTLRVEVQIEQPDEQLWPDMSARITFLEPAVAAVSGQTILAPKSAVRRSGDAAYAWIVRDGTARKIPLKLGRDFGEQIQVTEGISATDPLIVGDASALVEAQAVAVSTGAPH